MTELTISPEEIRSAISSYVSSLETGTSREEVGTVADTGDGIAHVEGLPSAMTNELLEFSGGVLGVALNLDVAEIGAVILGDYSGIEEGQPVKRTGEILSVPVGDGFLGRVVDSLGNPIDGLGDIEAEERRVLELQAASVMQRQSVSEPLQTGIKAIDAMTPIGRGQRQLIIGDRKTGKSAVCIDTIINQKQNWETGDPKQQVRCIYVAIGQKGSTIAGIRASLEEAGALEYTTIVASPASDPAGYKWIAPYTGSALGQHWMYQGNHVLIVFDDLSKQAEAYRAISLLLRRPPGREAYPGDVFYLHSRLLERCAKLSDELGAGSMTGLPIIETKANDVSAYIPTNVISITDGQVFLESDLFNQGVRPAINVGISVSRVGGAAQIKAMKQVSGLAAARPVAVPRAGGVRRVRLRPRRRVRCGAGSRRAAGRAAQAEPVLAVPGGRGGRLDLAGYLRPARHRARRGHPPVRDRLPRPPAAQRGRDPRRDPRHRQAARRDDRPAQGRGQELQGRLHRRRTGRRSSRRTSRSTRWTRTTWTASRSRSTGRSRPARPRARGQELQMAAQIRVLRRRIKSTQSIKKITRAMELIATSRIAKARARVDESRPYAEQITAVLCRSSRSARRWTTRCSSSGRTPRRPRSWSSPATAARPAATTTTCSRRPRRSRSCCASRARSRSST